MQSRGRERGELRVERRFLGKERTHLLNCQERVKDCKSGLPAEGSSWNKDFSASNETSVLTVSSRMASHQHQTPKGVRMAEVAWWTPWSRVVSPARSLQSQRSVGFLERWPDFPALFLLLTNPDKRSLSHSL